ncbi:MAG: RHS repeat-associated core domain-containing protein [Silvibacterium sp.]
MKTYAAVAIVLMILAMERAAQAQTCWSDVKSWTGNYDLTGEAPSGACVNPQNTCMTQDHSSANVSMTPTGPAACGGPAGWEGPDSNLSVSFNDTQKDPCGNGGESFDAATGETPVISGSGLKVNPSNGTYQYEGSAIGSGTFTSINCNGQQSTSPLPGWPLYPAANWPQTFTLPSSPQTLSPDTAQQSFDAESVIGQKASWKILFTLKPNYNPDGGCRQDGGQNNPENSSIGCQTQSLGEDVPVAGTGFKLHYEGSRAPGAGAGPIASADAAMIGGWTLTVHHAYDAATNTLFLGDGSQRNGYQLGTPVIVSSNFLRTSKDGSQVYVFNASNGQHLKTLRPLTGALVYQFGYDTAEKLVTVTDATGNVTTIHRNALEQPISIISPYGQTTTLAVDSNGFLSEVTDPLGKSAKFVNTSAGLLTSRTDENGNIFTYTYDDDGRLSKDADSLGGYTQLARTNATSGFGWTVGETTSMGRTSSYEDTLTLPWIQDGTKPMSEQNTNIWPDGLHATSSKKLENGQLSEVFDLPDGTSHSATSGPDPVWGLQVPVNTSETLTQGGLTMNVTGSRSTDLGMAGNPFSVSSKTDTQTINDRTYTSTFTASDRTYVNKTPVGRIITVGLDSLERVASTQLGELAGTDFTYDSRGRLAMAIQGPRKTTFSYNSDGFLASVTDPLQHTTDITYDADGHLSTTKLPDGRIITYAYDANGNLTSVTPPGKPAHDFAYNAVDLLSSYTPPTISGTGGTSYGYNLDRNLTKITRPDGKLISFDYDTAGRLSSVVTPSETIDYTNSATTGNLTSASITSGEGLTYAYDGPLLTSTKWTGTVNGTVGLGYNDNFWITSEDINGANTIAFTYDNDGLVTKAGALTLTSNAQNGLLTDTTLGSTTDARTYNSFGELTGYTASHAGTALYSVAYTRDADSRISSKEETISGKTNTYAYSYDLAGRLIGVSENGTSISSYSYDTNSNRLKAVTSSGTKDATYDVQDRLLTYGSAIYAYTANGELASQTVGTQKTTYQYDVLGNLTNVTLPTGKAITYVVDAENRRIGKKVSGSLVEGFLYDGNRIVAQLNASNAIVSQFVYASGSASPDYMISGGVTYRIFPDQLGSPRFVVNTSTGAIAEQITYDEFGNVNSDTNPGFQPFGFAGGLYDGDTKLLRFGARDYNPSVGRWTAKDRIRFNGGDTNLYGYAAGDPINQFDPTGLGSITINFYSGIGGGITIAYADGHLSAGFEIGVGKGIGIEVNPNTAPFQGDMLTDSQATLFLQSSARFGVCRFKAGVQSKERDNDGQFGAPEGVGQVCVGPFCTGTSGDSVRIPTSTSPEEGVGIQGKGGVQVVFPVF